MYEVIILKEGYSQTEGPGHQKACGTITLLKGPKNIIVDTGNPWDKDLILKGLEDNGILPFEVRFIVGTSALSDKVGNLNLFTGAIQIIAGKIFHHENYYLHAFHQTRETRIANENIMLSLPLYSSTVHVYQKSYTLALLGQGLEKHGTSPDKIEYVVCSHGHSDHVGNLNLFLHATHILSHDICHGDMYVEHNFDMGIPYEIDDDVEVVPTAGHTGSDVSVIVRNTKLGTVAVTGDLFECKEDLENPSLWQDNSEKPDIQEQSRINILRIADYIVPGHGEMFKVPDAYKRQMRVVMYYEEVQATTLDGKSESSKLEYVVMEED